MKKKKSPVSLELSASEAFEAALQRKESELAFELTQAQGRILSVLDGWDINRIECLLIHRVIPEAKRRARLEYS